MAINTVISTLINMALNRLKGKKNRELGIMTSGVIYTINTVSLSS